jgi:gliding motility-associated-like protein
MKLYTPLILQTAGWEIISGQGTISIKVKAGATSGEVTVKSKNECGESAGAGINVNVSTKPKTPGTIAGPADACAESEGFTYTINPVDGAEKYTWAVPAGWEIVNGQGTTTITVKAGKAAGSISVKAENKCGSSLPAEMPLTVSTKPEAPTAITGESSGCVGSSLTFIVKGGASDYNWTVPAGWSITGGQGTGTITVKVGEGSGTVEVKATNNCGESAGLSKSVSSITPPVAPAVISGPSSACGNTSGHTYSISEVPGATGYTWTVPAGWVIESGQGTTSITVKAGTASGDITVTAKNECGASPVATYKATASSKPQAPVTINGKSNGCIGEAMTYSVEGAPGATYNWTVPETWSISSGQGTSSIKVVVGSGAGNISVTITNDCGTSGVSEIAVSPLNNPAKPGAIDGPNATCSTSGNLTYSIAVLTGAESYNWKVPEGWTIVSGQGTLSITVQPGEQGGVISVTATNECGTSGSSSLDITVTPPPAAAVKINDLSSFCDGLKYSVDAVPEATSYTWNVPAGFAIVSGQGTPTITVKREDPNAFGDVTVVTNNGDCASPTTSLPIDASILEGELEFPKAYSPNGDGKNDTWVITNLEKYAKNQVIIFNRWGSEVYKQSNYQNNWNGNSLEQGTYYYKVSVTMCDGADKVFTGYVTIFR